MFFDLNIENNANSDSELPDEKPTSSRKRSVVSERTLARDSLASSVARTVADGPSVVV